MRGFLLLLCLNFISATYAEPRDPAALAQAQLRDIQALCPARGTVIEDRDLMRLYDGPAPDDPEICLSRERVLWDGSGFMRRYLYGLLEIERSGTYAAPQVRAALRALFPLRVGNSTALPAHWRGKDQRTEERYQVIGREQEAVNAGSFEVWKILRAQVVYQNGRRRCSSEVLYWYDVQSGALIAELFGDTLSFRADGSFAGPPSFPSAPGWHTLRLVTPTTSAP